MTLSVKFAARNMDAVGKTNFACGNAVCKVVVDGAVK
jgi:hypothetical protein